eukprot:6198605-Pleurochrysis_carterae.AAC.1
MQALTVCCRRRARRRSMTGSHARFESRLPARQRAPSLPLPILRVYLTQPVRYTLRIVLHKYPVQRDLAPCNSITIARILFALTVAFSLTYVPNCKLRFGDNSSRQNMNKCEGQTGRSPPLP